MSYCETVKQTICTIAFNCLSMVQTEMQEKLLNYFLWFIYSFYIQQFTVQYISVLSDL